MGTKGKAIPQRDDQDMESLVLVYAREQPELGQAKVAEALAARGHLISPSGVRYIWQRHDLETTFKRLRALEKAGADNASAPLSNRQKKVLKRGEASRKIAKLSAAIRDDHAAPAASDELILLAAARLFATKGYEGTSVREIADTAGLLPGSIYHHFPSKEDLFVSVHQEGFRQLTQLVEAAIAQGTTPQEKLVRLCTAHIEALVAVNPITTVAGRSLFSKHDASLEKRIADDRQGYEDLVRRQLNDLPLPPKTDRSLLRKFLLGALNWTLIWYQPGKKSPTDIARALVKQFCATPS